MIGRMVSRGVKLIGLGLAIWSLSLVWPEVNATLFWPGMAGLVLGLSAAVVIYFILKGALLTPSFQTASPGAGRRRPDDQKRPSKPMHLSPS